MPFWKYELSSTKATENFRYLLFLKSTYSDILVEMGIGQLLALVEKASTNFRLKI